MPLATELCLGASNNIVFLDVLHTSHGFLEIPEMNPSTASGESSCIGSKALIRVEMIDR